MKSPVTAFMMLMMFSGFLVSGITGSGLAQYNPAQYYSFKISGYILDSDGNGIAGAMIIFNVPQIVPAVLSDSSGYYVIYAPIGTYHVNVWPPFDSHYISYDEPALAVRSDITKNITLALGYKVSGYITDSSGAPIVKAVVSMDNFFCGWYSKYSGRYFVTAPAGTYTLNARPANGPQDVTDFLPYSESNVVVNGDLAKNITVETSPPTMTSENITSENILETEDNGSADANFDDSVTDNWTQHNDSLSTNEEKPQQDPTTVNTASDGTYTRSFHHVSVDLPEKADVTPLPSKEYWTWIVAAISMVIIGVSPLVYFRKRKH